jgi:hypothetical protein
LDGAAWYPSDWQEADWGLCVASVNDAYADVIAAEAHSTGDRNDFGSTDDYACTSRECFEGLFIAPFYDSDKFVGEVRIERDTCS